METPQPNTLFSGNWIRAHSGTYVNVFDPKPEMFLIEDIAEGLAYKYRWGGHSSVKITVAEHSVMVSNGLPIRHKLAGLLHDASEAYLSDIPSPIKQLLPEYKTIEDNVMACIALKFGFSWPLSTRVKTEDWNMLQREWSFAVVKNTWINWSNEKAKDFFLRKFATITK
jgi:hypothetical protein